MVLVPYTKICLVIMFSYNSIKSLRGFVKVEE